jgi:hypothetical protein
MQTHSPTRAPWQALLIIVSGGCLVFAAVTALNIARFASRAQHVDGTILAFERRPHSNRRYARVQYAVPQRGALEVTTPIPATWHEVGDALPMLYDRAHPEQARPGLFLSLWGVSLIGAIGAFIAGAAAARVGARAGSP